MGKRGEARAGTFCDRPELTSSSGQSLWVAGAGLPRGEWITRLYEAPAGAWARRGVLCFDSSPAPATPPHSQILPPTGINRSLRASL